MKQLVFVLAEAALETVPREIWGHPAVYKYARKRGKSPGQILLDRSIHHQAMKSLPEAEKRGRPDIVHITLLNVLGSPLNREGLMSVYVHTINDYVITVSPETRLPRNYNRFVGLIEQLFEKGKVPPDSEKPLLTIKPMTITRLLEEVRPTKTILFAEDGLECRLADIAKIIAKEEKPAVIIGGFPHGDFRRETRQAANLTVSIYGGVPLDTWVIASHIVTALEIELGIV